jgi:hypothetical protein
MPRRRRRFNAAMIHRRLFLLVVCLFALPLWATQPNPSVRQRELIDEMLTLTHPEDAVRQSLDTMLEELQKSLNDTLGEAPDEAARVRRAEGKKDFDRYRELVRDTIDFKSVVREIYVPLYAKYFSEQQLADLIVFYKTPTGQRYINSLPDFQRDAVRASNNVFAEKIGAILKQVRDEHSKRRPWEKTMSDIRVIATAIEAWSTDHDDKYPDGGAWEHLRKELQPTYVKELPEKDSWGTAYAYVVSPERDHYRIVSAGADSVFDWDSRRIAVPKKKADDDEEETPLKLSERLEDDIIYADGVFLQIPRAAQHDQ